MPDCPKCNTPFKEGNKFCIKCGHNLEDEFILNPIFPKCGREFVDGTKFCELDGTPLVSREKLVPRCIICGKEYPNDVKFCPVDGGSVIPEAFRENVNIIEQFKTENFNFIYPKASLGNRFLAMLLDTFFELLLAAPALIFIIPGISDKWKYRGRGLFIVGAILLIIPLVYDFIKDGLGEGQSSLGFKHINAV